MKHNLSYCGEGIASIRYEHASLSNSSITNCDTLDESSGAHVGRSPVTFLQPPSKAYNSLNSLPPLKIVQAHRFFFSLKRKFKTIRSVWSNWRVFRSGGVYKFEFWIEMEGKGKMVEFNKLSSPASTHFFVVSLYLYHDCQWLSVPLRGRPEQQRLKTNKRGVWC